MYTNYRKYNGGDGGYLALQQQPGEGGGDTYMKKMHACYTTASKHYPVGPYLVVKKPYG